MSTASTLAEQLTANGQVTDIGGALNDLAHRNPSGSLAGLIVFSDFNKTAGPDPAQGGPSSLARRSTRSASGPRRPPTWPAASSPRRYAKTKEDVPITVSLGAERTRRPNHARPPVCRTAGRRQAAAARWSAKRFAAALGLDAAVDVHLQAGAGRPDQARGRSGPAARRSQSRQDPCRPRDRRDGRLPAADVRRVRADLGMAVHQGGLPPRPVGGHEGVPHVPVLVRSAGPAAERAVPGQHDSAAGRVLRERPDLPGRHAVGAGPRRPSAIASASWSRNSWARRAADW